MSDMTRRPLAFFTVCLAVEPRPFASCFMAAVTSETMWATRERTVRKAVEGGGRVGGVSFFFSFFSEQFLTRLCQPSVLAALRRQLRLSLMIIIQVLFPVLSAVAQAGAAMIDLGNLFCWLQAALNHATDTSRAALQPTHTRTHTQISSSLGFISSPLRAGASMKKAYKKLIYVGQHSTPRLRRSLYGRRGLFRVPSGHFLFSVSVYLYVCVNVGFFFSCICVSNLLSLYPAFYATASFWDESGSGKTGPYSLRFPFLPVLLSLIFQQFTTPITSPPKWQYPAPLP